jgi:ribosomal protein L11 methylase PrmA
MDIKALPASFKDPSGFVFSRNGRIYRQINTAYKSDYEMLINSGLYAELAKAGFLISHMDATLELPTGAYKIIEPVEIPFISYPYEWCFDQLKDAALLTLAIQKKAFGRGMILKDASAFNVQFIGSKPIFIDTLSFEQYREEKPWAAYKQFCEHFLAPLALAAFKDIRLAQLARVHLDGIPLELAAKLLPLRAKTIPAIFFHIVLHARAQKSLSNRNVATTANGQKFSRAAFAELIDNLETTVNNLTWRPEKTVWTDYGGETCESYDNAALEQKKSLVEKFVKSVGPKNTWDIGANSGTFSRIAANTGTYVVSIDSDPSVIEKNYLTAKTDRQNNLLPLLADITNPTPGIGWANAERDSLADRKKPNMVLALALIHHLAIAKNIPLATIACFFGDICDSLAIEFIPKEDRQVQRLLNCREDIFVDYNEKVFETEFDRYFKIREKIRLTDSKRTLYLMIHNKTQ